MSTPITQQVPKDKRLYLDLDALVARLNLFDCHLSVHKCGKDIGFFVDDKPVLEQMTTYVEGKISVDELTQMVNMSEAMNMTNETTRLATLMKDYAGMMNCMNYQVSVWSIIKRLRMCIKDKDITLDKNNIVSAFGPNNRPIKRVPIHIGDTVIELICTGNIPCLYTKQYRAVELVVKNIKESTDVMEALLHGLRYYCQ